MPTLVKISIIVCAYNGQRFLPKCLDSVFNQSLSEIEIIMVNDGSTDQTFNIMTEYRNKYNSIYGDRITIINQPNLGTAIARRNGVMAAKGIYIGFVDCDDYISLDRFEKMYDCANKHNADIVQSRARGLPMKYDNQLYGGNRLKSSEDVLKVFLTNKDFSPMLWQQIQKRSLYNKYTFPNWHEIHEDEFAYPMLLINAKSVYFLNEQLYFYNTTNMQGTMGQVYRNQDGRYRQSVSLLRSCQRVEIYLKKKNKIRSYRKEFIYYKSWRLFNFILQSIVSGNIGLSKIYKAIHPLQQ